MTEMGQAPVGGDTQQRLARLRQRREATDITPRPADTAVSPDDRGSPAGAHPVRGRRGSAAAGAKILTTGLSFTAVFALTAGYAVADHLATSDDTATGSANNEADSSPLGDTPVITATSDAIVVREPARSQSAPASAVPATGPSPVSTDIPTAAAPTVPPVTEPSAVPSGPVPVTVDVPIVDVVDLSIPAPPRPKRTANPSGGSGRGSGAASPAPAPAPAPAPPQPKKKQSSSGGS